LTAALTSKAAAATSGKPPIWRRCLFGGLLLLLLFGIHRIDSRLPVPWISLSLTILLGLLGAFEYHRLLGHRVRLWPGMLFIAVLLIGKAAALVQGGDARVFAEAGLLGLFICLLILEVLSGKPEEGPPRIGATLGGFCYFYLYSFLLDLLLRPEAPVGLQLAFLLVLTAKSTDIGGYLVGNWIGGRKLAPRVSPGKTWSGAVGGVLLSVLVAGFGGSLLAFDVGTLQWLLFGLLVGLLALIGDLAESLLKRFAGQKDSAALIPTFGGALDLLDSLVLAAPFGTWYLIWLRPGLATSG